MKNISDTKLRSQILNSMYANHDRHGFLLVSIEDDGYRSFFDLYELKPNDIYYEEIIGCFEI